MGNVWYLRGRPSIGFCLDSAYNIFYGFCRVLYYHLLIMLRQVIISAIHDFEDYTPSRIQPSPTRKIKFRQIPTKFPTIYFKSGQISDQMTVCGPWGGGGGGGALGPTQIKCSSIFFYLILQK